VCSFPVTADGLSVLLLGHADRCLAHLSEVVYHPKGISLRLSALTSLGNAESLTTFLHTDPFHRVDVLPSGRHVKIEIDGVVLADTGTEGGVMSLWETNFPGRWYLPRTAVRLFSLSHPPFPLKLLTDVADQLGIPHPKRNPHWLPLQRRGILLQRRH